MIEGVLQPAHLLVSLLLFLLWFGVPIWFGVYVVRSLRRIDVSVREIAERLRDDPR